MSPELVFREVPGKSRQRRRHPRRRRLRPRRSLLDPPRDCVARVRRPPPALRLPPERRAARPRARTLSRPNPRIRMKPSTTNRARTLATTHASRIALRLARLERGADRVDPSRSGASDEDAFRRRRAPLREFPGRSCVPDCATRRSWTPSPPSTALLLLDLAGRRRTYPFIRASRRGPLLASSAGSVLASVEGGCRLANAGRCE